MAGKFHLDRFVIEIPLAAYSELAKVMRRDGYHDRFGPEGIDMTRVILKAAAVKEPRRVTKTPPLPPLSEQDKKDLQEDSL